MVFGLMKNGILFKTIRCMKKILLNLIGLVFSLFSAFSQPGDIDVSFNTTDIGFGNGDGANSTVYCSEIQNDGKVVLGGFFTKYNGTFINRIARIDSNGRLDNTFNPGSGANSTVKAIAIQSNGKIIIGGSLTTFNGMSVNRLARLNDDGSLDQTFNFNLFTNGSIETIAIQNNGKIIIGGSFTYFINGITRKGIARLNEDGTFDQTFNLETNNYSPIYKVAIQNDGKIIIGGDFSFSFNGAVITRIARINSNGTLDNTFISGGANNDVLTLSIQNDGKIIVGGRFTKFNGYSQDILLD
jgi:uncharacterized delta-60 repeat protein